MNNIKSGISFLGRQPWTVSFGASVLILLALIPMSSRSPIDVLLSNFALSSFVAIAALGQMIVVSTGRGAVDLSIPYTITLSVYVATIIQEGKNDNLFISIVAALAVGALVGAVNGFAVVVLRIPAMVATLSVGFIAQSIVQILSSTAGHVGPSPAIADLSRADVFGFSVFTLIAIGMCVLVALLLFRTAFGVRLLGTGQNDVAARLAGLKPSSTRWVAFVLSGLFAGITAILLGGYSGGASLGVGASFLISSIAAVVLGGASLAGGVGTVLGTVLGLALLAIMQNGLILVGVSSYWSQFFVGLVILLSVSATALSARRKRKGNLVA